MIGRERGERRASAERVRGVVALRDRTGDGGERVGRVAEAVHRGLDLVDVVGEAADHLARELIGHVLCQLGKRLLAGPGDQIVILPADECEVPCGGHGVNGPARLADGEFVVPADVVSHLGNGSTDAGAKQLYKMMDKVRTARTGRKSQGKQINPKKYIPT